MRRFKTTQSLIASRATNLTVGSTTETLGYSAEGDGCNVVWVFNGVTGQTPSQSPIDLNSNSVTDADGNKWDLSPGSTVDYNGSQWFPLPFGAYGISPYILGSLGFVGVDWVEVAANVTLPEPDVSIPFNDGLTIERGYGENGKEVTFSRASGTGNRNKSGVAETLAIDEPAITSDGLSVYESVTNEILYSEDFSNAAWIKASVTLSTDGTLSPDGVTLATKVHNDALGSGVSYVRQLISSSQNKVLTAVWVMGTAGETLKIESRAVNSSVVSQVAHTLTGGWELLSSFSGVDWGGQTDASVYSGVRMDSVNTAQDFYIAMATCAITDLEFVPYIKTTTTPVTRAADVASIPMMNNMPAQGKPFTIVCDCDFNELNQSQVLFSAGASAATRIRIRANSSFILPYMGDGQAAVIGDGISKIGLSKSRFALRYSGGSFIMFVDGVAVGNETAINTSACSLLESIMLGSSIGLEFINSEISNFRIYHQALTTEQISRLGSAE